MVLTPEIGITAAPTLPPCDLETLLVALTLSMASAGSALRHRALLTPCLHVRATSLLFRRLRTATHVLNLLRVPGARFERARVECTARGGLNATTLPMMAAALLVASASAPGFVLGTTWLSLPFVAKPLYTQALFSASLPLRWTVWIWPTAFFAAQPDELDRCGPPLYSRCLQLSTECLPHPCLPECCNVSLMARFMICFARMATSHRAVQAR